MEIFQLSRTWPSEEKFSLVDQIRRSSRSVCTNIAEAWRKRRYEAAFISKLSDSDAEAAETEVHLGFALDCGYLPAEKHTTLLDHYDHICAQLTKMINDAPSWCGSAGELREVPPEYVVGLSRSDAPTLPRSDAPTLPRSDAPTLPRSHAPTLPRSHAPTL